MTPSNDAALNITYTGILTTLSPSHFKKKKKTKAL